MKKMNKENREKIIDLLQTAYSAELETMENYLAWSINLDGIHALHIKEMLAKDLQDELGHAKRLAERIYILGGTVPGSMQLNKSQRYLQPSSASDLALVIQGIVIAEESAISHYRLLAEMTEGIDMPTHDLAIELLADEEMHRREFAGILQELQKDLPEHAKQHSLTY